MAHRRQSLPLRERGLKCLFSCDRILPDLVAPSAGAWIEMCQDFDGVLDHSVAPSAGAWIEIYLNGIEQALKLVAPSAGAWIEIFRTAPCAYQSIVAPSAGAWIEIDNMELINHNQRSLPLRERGLKYKQKAV